MKYDFSQMNPESFELMVRSLNEKKFGVKCKQYGSGPDGQREFTFEGEIRDSAGTVFAGRTIGQVKYKDHTGKRDDYQWLVREIGGELKRFREKEKEYIPDNYLFYTNVVLTPTKGTGIKDKIDAYVKENNGIIKNFYVRGYDEICAMLDNNRDVASCYAAFITSGDVLMRLLTGENADNSRWISKYLYCEFEEDLYTRMEQAGSATEKKISIEKVCVDINVQDRAQGEILKFAEHVFSLGNQILGYKKGINQKELDRKENYVLIGGPGKGKSTICQFIAQVYRMNYLLAMGKGDKATEEFAAGIKDSYNYEINHQRIPFIVTLRDYAAWMKRKSQEENVSVMQYIRERIHKIEGDDIQMQALRTLMRELAWIFFFDGLDEVPESSNRNEVLKQINIFISTELREAECDCMIIGTTRAQGYNHDFGKEKYTHLEIADFLKEDCKKYIRKLFSVMEERTEQRETYIRIMMEALEDEITGRLMETPLQATIIAILVKSGGRPPHERYSLFRQYYDTVIRREKQKDIVTTLNDHTDWLEEIHHLLGYRLQRESEEEGNPSAEIRKIQLQEIIRTYVEENWDEFYEIGHEREKKEQEILLIITQRICFLSENREDCYSFSLRSIQEYFAGTFLVKGTSDQDAMDHIRGIAYSSYWRNVLLFALGYIELERKSLEPEIGSLCEQMNGKENIMREDYTSENLCLFGSWLAIDLLAENIFRGKQQEKYIQLASKVMHFTDSDAYHAFSCISGVTKDKLVHYVRDHCCDNKEGWEKTVRLFLKLDENDKNDLESDILDAMGQLASECQIGISIEILEYKTYIGTQLYEVSVDRVMQALEQGEIKYFLSYEVLFCLLNSVNREMSLLLKKALILQCIYCDNSRIRDSKQWDKLDIKCEEEKVLKYLMPWHVTSFLEHGDIVDGFNINFIGTETVDKHEVKMLQAEMQRLELDYLFGFCQFLLEPSLIKYQELCAQLEEEQEFLSKRYREVLKFYVPNDNIQTEEEFQRIQQKRKLDYQELGKGNYKQFYYRETDIRLRCSVKYGKNIFDKLMDQGELSIEKLGLLSGWLFDRIVVAASYKIQNMEEIIEFSEKTAERTVCLVCEAERRKKSGVHITLILAVLLASEYKKRLWERLPEIGISDYGIENQLIFSEQLWWAPCIEIEEMRNIIGSIIAKVVYEEKESGYLSMIPIIINYAIGIIDIIDIRTCISEHDLEILKKIEYARGANLLAVKLLNLCMNDNSQPGKVIQDILACNVSHKIIFLELKSMLFGCQVKNKEKLYVEMYFRLVEEEFDDRKELQIRVVEHMMKEKSKVTVK